MWPENDTELQAYPLEKYIYKLTLQHQPLHVV
jgi:hypothetical protein